MRIQTQIISIFILCLNIILLSWIPIQIKIQEYDLWPILKINNIEVPAFAYHLHIYFNFYIIIIILIVIALIIKEFFVHTTFHRILINIITLYFLIIFAIIIANSLIGVFPEPFTEIIIFSD